MTRWVQLVWFPSLEQLETAHGAELPFHVAGIVRDLIAENNKLAPEDLVTSLAPAEDGYHFVRVEAP